MKNLCDQIDALLSMDEAGALVPHGIGGHSRELLTAARAEIARLTDAGAENTNAPGRSSTCGKSLGEQSPEPVAADQNAEVNAPGASSGPPAAADRGVPGQRVSEVDLTMFAEIGYGWRHGDNAHNGTLLLDRIEDLVCDIRSLRAALATAPKAEKE